jgi:hypothetical protein
MSVILQPCGNKAARQHFQDTISSPVSFSAHEDLLASIKPELDRLFPTGKAAVWGVVPGKNGVNINKYKRTEVGDTVLFSRDGGMVNSAILALKFHSVDFANRLWGKDLNGQTWEYVYFLDEVQAVSFTYREFNEAVGYEPNNVVQGFTVMHEEKSEAASEYFSLRSKIHLPPSDKAKYVDTLDRIKELEATERKVQSTARNEQAYLRTHLFPKGTRTAECAICGKTYPIDVRVAAHIKRRAACTRDEKLDALNIVMPVCKIGCDELYERGYIAVSESGAIITGDAPTSDLSALLGEVAGKPCAAHSNDSAKYFEWHRDKVYLRDA